MKCANPLILVVSVSLAWTRRAASDLCRIEDVTGALSVNLDAARWAYTNCVFTGDLVGNTLGQPLRSQNFRVAGIISWRQDIHPPESCHTQTHNDPSPAAGKQEALHQVRKIYL